MKSQLKICSILMPGLLLVPAAHAEPPINTQIEVNFLLGYVDGSGCQFYRNGSWYDSKAAQDHLRDKYNYLSGSAINTTEDFIEKAATKSSFSGQPYGVKCNSGVSQTSNKWLRDELARFRSF
jgi:Family of unknown function (DUF5329)